MSHSGSYGKRQPCFSQLSISLDARARLRSPTDSRSQTSDSDGLSMSTSNDHLHPISAVSPQPRKTRLSVGVYPKAIIPFSTFLQQPVRKTNDASIFNFPNFSIKTNERRSIAPKSSPPSYWASISNSISIVKGGAPSVIHRRPGSAVSSNYSFNADRFLHLRDRSIHHDTFADPRTSLFIMDNKIIKGQHLWQIDINKEVILEPRADRPLLKSTSDSLQDQWMGRLLEQSLSVNKSRLGNLHNISSVPATPFKQKIPLTSAETFRVQINDDSKIGPLFSSYRKEKQLENCQPFQFRNTTQIRPKSRASDSNSSRANQSSSSDDSTFQQFISQLSTNKSQNSTIKQHQKNQLQTTAFPLPDKSKSRKIRFQNKSQDQQNIPANIAIVVSQIKVNNPQQQGSDLNVFRKSLAARCRYEEIKK